MSTRRSRGKRRVVGSLDQRDGPSLLSQPQVDLHVEPLLDYELSPRCFQPTTGALLAVFSESEKDIEIHQRENGENGGRRDAYPEE